MKFSDHKQTAKEYKIGGLYWRPEDGDNRVRVLSEYEVYGFHWDNKTRKGGVCIGKNEGCTWCKAGNKPAAKFLMWVIDRADEDTPIKIMQIGYTVIQQLGDLQLNSDWAFEHLPDYDINIRKTGKDLETKYFVTPTPNKTPLTADEEEAVKNLQDLKEVISKMKEKAGGSPDVIQVEDVPPEPVPPESVPPTGDAPINPTAPENTGGAPIPF